MISGGLRYTTKTVEQGALPPGVPNERIRTACVHVAVIPLAGHCIGGQLVVSAGGRARRIHALFLLDDSMHPSQLVVCQNKEVEPGTQPSGPRTGQSYHVYHYRPDKGQRDLET